MFFRIEGRAETTTLSCKVDMSASVNDPIPAASWHTDEHCVENWIEVYLSSFLALMSDFEKRTKGFQGVGSRFEADVESKSERSVEFEGWYLFDDCVL